MNMRYLRILGAICTLLWTLTAAAAPAYPVRYSLDQRYLVDQNSVPFPILGRTAWFVLSLPAHEYYAFIIDTAARGFNAIELHVLNHDPRGTIPRSAATVMHRSSSASMAGHGAERSRTATSDEAPDFTTPNEAFWSFVDTFLAYCETRGILVFLFPAYVGYSGSDQGWMQEMVANGSARIQSYGAWIANRYRNPKNLVWMLGGDMQTFDPVQTAVEVALLNGLKGVPEQQSTLFSAEWSSNFIATDQPTLGSEMTLNGAYSWSGEVSLHGRRAYAYNPTMPAFLLEEPYDQEGPNGNGVNPNAIQPVRRFQWWGWLSTIGGYIAGNGYVWPVRTSTL